MGGNFQVGEFFRDTFNLDHYQNYESWFLFLLGVIFAIIALIDGVASDDLYFGYGKVDRQEKEAKNAIQDLLDELTDDLETIKEKIVNNIQVNKIEIIDNTHIHKKHKSFNKSKLHLKIIIESDSLKSFNKIDSHKKIINLLKDEIEKKIHSLEIKIN